MHARPLFPGMKRPHEGQSSGSLVSPLVKRPHISPVLYRTPSAPQPLRVLPWDKVTGQIAEFFEAHRQSQQQYNTKRELRDALFAVVRDVFPYCGLYIVGSSMNGFGSITSDLDLCLMLSDKEIDKKQALAILQQIQRSIRQCSFVTRLLVIKAKVPILKFKDEISQIECDLNINNSIGIRNTHLLSAYTQLDRRITPLALMAKHWAKTQRINDASQATISSYSLVLMVLHFLQYACSPAVIPSLQVMYPQMFNLSVDVRQLTLSEKLPPYQSLNTQSTGELFFEFLKYYATRFDFSDMVISVRLAKTVSRCHVVHRDPTQWKFMCIEEPFDLSNAARCVHNENIFERILHVIRTSYQVLQRTHDIHSIIFNPL